MSELTSVPANNPSADGSLFHDRPRPFVSLSDGRFLSTQREALEALTPAVRRQLGIQDSVPHG